MVFTLGLAAGDRVVIMSSSRIRSPRARPLASRATHGLVPTRRAEMCPWRCPITHETSVPCTPPVAPRGIYTGAVGNHTRPPGHLEHLALSRHRAGETREVGLRPSLRE